jgi:hypothetical protein
MFNGKRNPAASIMFSLLAEMLPEPPGGGPTAASLRQNRARLGLESPNVGFQDEGLECFARPLRFAGLAPITQ